MVYLVVRHFRLALEGRPAKVFTDPKSLANELHAAPDLYSSRETRHVDIVSQLTLDI